MKITNISLFFIALHPYMTMHAATAVKVPVTAYKMDPATHDQVWHIQVTDFVPTRTKRSVDAPITIQNSATLPIFMDKLTYLSVYKPSADPVVSIIRPEELAAATSDPVIMINNDGTTLITSREIYERMKRQPKMAAPLTVSTRVPQMSNCPAIDAAGNITYEACQITPQTVIPVPVPDTRK